MEGELGGVEIGFLHAVAAAARLGQRVTRHGDIGAQVRLLGDVAAAYLASEKNREPLEIAATLPTMEAQP